MIGPALADLVADRRAELGLSLKAAAEKSAGQVSHSHLQRIENGEHNVSDRVLVGISEALALPLSRVRAAAGVTPRTPRPFVMPARADRLNARERRLVLNVIDTLLAAHEDR